MRPTDFLKELMRKSGDNPNSLAAKLNNRTKQPQIYKFLEGIAKEPRRTTLQPVADFYKVKVEAFYDPYVADEEMGRILVMGAMAEDDPPRSEVDLILRAPSDTAYVTVKPPRGGASDSGKETNVTLAEALEVLGNWVMSSGDLDRDQVRPLINRMFDEPGRTPEIIARIAATTSGTQGISTTTKKIGNEEMPDFLKK